MESQVSHYTNLVVDVQVPAPGQEQAPENPSPVEQIGLVFTFRIRRSRFDVAEDGQRTLVWQREGLRIPLCDHQFRAGIFNSGDDSLFRQLSWSFKSFDEDIDAEVVADAIIERWIQIRDEVNAISSGRVFTMTVNLISWYIEARHEITPHGTSTVTGECGMIPACDEAIGKMLKKFQIEEDCSDRICVICLDRLRKNRRYALQMPCLHVFHGKCIEEWLKKSHYCPICRFEMPTNLSNSF